MSVTVLARETKLDQDPCEDPTVGRIRFVVDWSSGKVAENANWDIRLDPCCGSASHLHLATSVTSSFDDVA